MLQDAASVDVNILLFVCWRAGFADGRLASQEIARLIEATAPLQEETIKPLRQARRAIRKGSDREPERQQLLQLELAAEKAELDLLGELAGQECGARVGDWTQIVEAAHANLQLCFAQTGAILTYADAVRLMHIARMAADIHLGRR